MKYRTGTGEFVEGPMLSEGKIPATQLGSGTATGSKFLRDDQTWAVPSGGPGGEAFPVGSVFIAVVSTNPATLLGYGTWSAIAAGRVLVGIDSGDTDFDTVKETGGAKTVAAAGTNSAPTISGSTASAATGISIADHTGTRKGGTTNPGSIADGALAHNITDNGHTHGAGTLAASAPTFTGSATSVVQPYFVVYMWERTA